MRAGQRLSLRSGRQQAEGGSRRRSLCHQAACRRVKTSAGLPVHLHYVYLSNRAPGAQAHTTEAPVLTAGGWKSRPRSLQGGFPKALPWLVDAPPGFSLGLSWAHSLLSALWAHMCSSSKDTSQVGLRPTLKVSFF